MASSCSSLVEAAASIDKCTASSGFSCGIDDASSIHAIPERDVDEAASSSWSSGTSRGTRLIWRGDHYKAHTAAFKRHPIREKPSRAAHHRRGLRHGPQHTETRGRWPI